MKYKYLSHILEKKLPVYGGNGLMDIAAVRSIAKGDSANISRFSMNNHWGTHIDMPKHFFEQGRSVVDYPADFWFFRSPKVIKIALKPSEVLRCGAWMKAISLKDDILLFRSNWSLKRGRRIYSLENPGIHPDVGICLRKKYGNIRAIGIDWISLSSYQDRKLGREAHKAFLDPKGIGKPVPIIEDMKLEDVSASLKEVYIFPLRVKGMDSAPCTVIGGFHD